MNKVINVASIQITNVLLKSVINNRVYCNVNNIEQQNIYQQIFSEPSVIAINAKAFAIQEFQRNIPVYFEKTPLVVIAAVKKTTRRPFRRRFHNEY